METAAVGTTEIEGRGRAMVALRPLKAGEIVLTDSPILLYSALPVPVKNDHHHHPSYYCSHCFIQQQQQSQSQTVSCSSCRSLFCSIDCLSLASATSHTPWACQALTRLHHQYHHLGLSLDLLLQARFLISAYNLAYVSPARFQTLLSLQGSLDADADADAEAVYVHSLVSSHCPPPAPQLGFSLELTSLLLTKDKLNAFGLMEPFSEDREERSVRAYAIYPLASFFNHDCLPNACRFDYIDVPRHNTDITIRMIHDVPQGREICLSYFPVNLKYSQRQNRLRDDYGFVCDCDRCKVEAHWSDSDDQDDHNNEEGEEEEEETTADMDEDSDEEHMGAQDIDVIKGQDQDFPHAYFFLTYMCDRKNCWGTLAPLPPSVVATSPGVMECNVCGNFKNSDQA